MIYEWLPQHHDVKIESLSLYFFTPLCLLYPSITILASSGIVDSTLVKRFSASILGYASSSNIATNGRESAFAILIIEQCPNSQQYFPPRSLFLYPSKKFGTGFKQFGNDLENVSEKIRLRTESIDIQKEFLKKSFISIFIKLNRLSCYNMPLRIPYQTHHLCL